MSRKIPPTSHPSLEGFKISWEIDKSLLMQKCPGMNPEWFWDIKPFSVKKQNMLFYNNLSKIFPHICRRETGL